MTQIRVVDMGEIYTYRSLPVSQVTSVEEKAFSSYMLMVETPLLERKSSFKVAFRPIPKLTSRKSVFRSKRTQFILLAFDSGVATAKHKAHEKCNSK
jgi:hypothetical protein